MRILAIPNAHALAHVSRLLEICRLLRAMGHEIMFAGHGKYLKIAKSEQFSIFELPYITVEQVVSAVRSQRLWELYPEIQLREFIKAELALYTEFQPDLVLIDNRPTARTSAELAGIKTAAVVNVHMSNYRKIPFFSLRNLLRNDQAPGVEFLDRIENFFECHFYNQLVMKDLNKVRKSFGLSALFSYEHERGDRTFFADIPEFSPLRKMPNGAQYIGPLTWHNTLSPPKCVEKFDKSKPIVYMTLGSEGLEDLLAHLGELAGDNVQIVVALGAVKPESLQALNVPNGVFLEEFVNTDLLLPHCDLVCCHGGNGTIYQALSYGLPLIVVATHQEQYYGGKRLQRLGLGQAFMLEKVKARGLGVVTESIRAVLADKRYRERAILFSNNLRNWNGAQIAAQTIDEFLRKK